MRLLFIDDEKQLSDIVLAELPREWAKHAAYTLADARRILEHNIIDVIVLDLRLPDGDGLSLLPEILHQPDAPEVFVLTGHGSVSEAIQAMRFGVFDFINKPVTIDVLESVIRAGGMRKGIGEITAETVSPAAMDSLAPGLRFLGMQSLQISKTNIPILILGERGSGKANFTRFIHQQSGRQKGPWVDFDCAALPIEAQEAALFGALGADAPRGQIGAAQQGTLVLRNISALGAGAQGRLLRWLDSGEQIDFRLIALTDMQLQAQIESRAFREDLFFRLSGFSITIPPLRRRPGDVLFLARQYATREISDAAAQALDEYTWPGNVTELQSVVEKACVFAEDVNVIRKHHIESAIGLSEFSIPNIDTAPLTLDAIEAAHIRKVLKLAEGNQTRAAKLLGIDPKTLYRKLKQYQMLANEPVEST